MADKKIAGLSKIYNIKKPRVYHTLKDAVCFRFLDFRNEIPDSARELCSQHSQKNMRMQPQPKGRGFFLGLRKNLKKRSYRKIFFKKNKRENKKNVAELVKYFIDAEKVDKKWKAHIVVSDILSMRKIAPYDYNSFSSSNLLGASKEQGYEIMVFFNSARMGFLSQIALVPLILHEIEHVKQAMKFPESYAMSMFDDKLSRDLEREADKKSSENSNFNELRKQEVLESVLYCYDNFGGWNGAQKMADFWHKDIEKIYGGGYMKNMTDEEYKAFLEAKKKKKIELFIEFFARLF